MMKSVQDIDHLMVVLRRPEAGGPIKGVVLPRGSLRASLLLKPADLIAALGPLAKLAGQLPEVRLSPAQKTRRRKLSGARLGACLRNYAFCARSAPGMLLQRDGLGGPTWDRMDQLAELMDRYAGITRYAQQGVSRGMDLRLLVGAFQWFLLKQALTAVKRRIQDPATPASERSKLQNAFSGLLLHQEQFQMDNQARRDQRDQANQDVQKQLAEAQKRQALLDTIHAMHMNLPVDQASLEQVADFYAELLQKQQAGADAGPGAASGGSTAAGGTGHHGGTAGVPHTGGTGTPGLPHNPTPPTVPGDQRRNSR